MLVPALERVARQFAGQRVVVVAHGVVCKVLLLALLANRGPAGWQALGRVANLAVSKLQFDGMVWTAERLLEVPPPVAELTAAHEARTGEKSQG